MNREFDFIIIGSGIVGLTSAYQIKKKFPQSNVLIIEKETEIAYHASGRNSGVLHAGFYYPPNSLKAKFTINGNYLMREFCKKNQLKIKDCGKLVVAKNAEELKSLEKLYERGLENNSGVSLISYEDAKKIEPGIITYKKALYSPNTAVVDPKEICLKFKEILESKNVKFLLSTKYLSQSNEKIVTSRGSFGFKKLINAAGLYSDKIAQDFQLGLDYTMIPFRGNYLKVNAEGLSTNIYPVPDLNYPFLGVHFTRTVYDDSKIGPTATPAFWRENYSGMSRFNLFEFFEIIRYESELFLLNKFNFRDLAIDEIRKYKKSYLLKQAKKMKRGKLSIKKGAKIKPGIRAQLLNKKTKELVNDFLIESNERSVHILNSVSPAFTCSLAFSEYIVENYL